MDMIIVGTAVIGGALAGAGLMYAVMMLRMKKVREETIDKTLKTYLGILTKTMSVMDDLCSGCAHSCNGKSCNRLDTANIVRYGKCTNFEERRF